jgi:hypothetical protein
MNIFSTSTTSYIPLVNILGLHFQIRDDYINLCSTSYEANKGFAEDLTEGKYSFPVIHHLHTVKNGTQMRNILKQRTEDAALKKYAIEELLEKQSGSFAYTRDRLKTIEKEARDEIARLGGNKGLEAVLDFLARDYVPCVDKEASLLVTKDELINRLCHEWALYPDHVVFLGAEAVFLLRFKYEVQHVLKTGETLRAAF